MFPPVLVGSFPLIRGHAPVLWLTLKYFLVPPWSVETLSTIKLSRSFHRQPITCSLNHQNKSCPGRALAQQVCYRIFAPQQVDRLVRRVDIIGTEGDVMPKGLQKLVREEGRHRDSGLDLTDDGSKHQHSPHLKKRRKLSSPGSGVSFPTPVYSNARPLLEEEHAATRSSSSSSPSTFRKITTEVLKNMGTCCLWWR